MFVFIGVWVVSWYNFNCFVGWSQLTIDEWAIHFFTSPNCCRSFHSVNLSPLRELDVVDSVGLRLLVLLFRVIFHIPAYQISLQHTHTHTHTHTVVLDSLDNPGTANTTRSFGLCNIGWRQEYFASSNVHEVKSTGAFKSMQCGNRPTALTS